MVLPILYSLRNCPYAIRARLAIFASSQPVLLRDIQLANKPTEMLRASPKGTVPVLVVDNRVIDESVAIMQWALQQSDPNDYLHKTSINADVEMLKIINTCDGEFSLHLNQYRCAKRYHEPSVINDRKQCEPFIEDLERRLSQHCYLLSAHPSLADLAIMPFIRQFARVERQWYRQSPYPNVRQWLDNYLQSRMFSKVMAQHPLWLEQKKDLIFDAR